MSSIKQINTPPVLITPDRLINEPINFYSILSILICLLIFILLFVFKKSSITSLITLSVVNGEKSKDAEIRDGLIVLFTVFFGLFTLFTIIPSFGFIKTLFIGREMRTVSIVVVYTLLLVLLFTMLPNDMLDKYSKIITPVTVLLGFVLLVIGYADGYLKSGYIEYIRTIVLFTCFVTMMTVFYEIDPGGKIKDYFNNTILTQILLGFSGIFGILYTMVTLSMFSSVKKLSEPTNTSRFIGPGLVGLILFLSLFVYGIGYTDFSKDKTLVTGVTVLTLVAIFLWSILFGVGLSNVNKPQPNISGYKTSLLLLFGTSISLIIALWFIQNLNNTPSVLNAIEWFFGIIIFIALLILVYKILSRVYGGIIPTSFKEDILYNKKTDLFWKLSKELKNTSINSLIALITVIVAFGAYFVGPIIYNKYSISGGKVLLSKPSNLNEQNTLATYEELNGPVPEKEPTEYDGGESRTFNYNYGLSFWIYIDSSAPNTNSSYSKYTSILNYGGKPNILYKASTNTLVITFDDKPIIDNDQDIDNINETNDYGRRIVYKKDNFALQRWNHFVINYSGRYLDVFLNGELVKSNIKVVPHMKLDSLVSGSENGIYGGLCNIVYYNKPLTITKINSIYSMLKDKTPPVL